MISTNFRRIRACARRFCPARSVARDHVMFRTDRRSQIFGQGRSPPPVALSSSIIIQTQKDDDWLRATSPTTSTSRFTLTVLPHITITVSTQALDHHSHKTHTRYYLEESVAGECARDCIPSLFLLAVKAAPLFEGRSLIGSTLISIVTLVEAEGPINYSALGW